MLGSVLVVACGRTGIEPCAWQACADAEGGSPASGNGGAPTTAGKPPVSSGGARAGAPTGGGMGGVSGGVAGTLFGGAGAAAGEGGSGGESFEPPFVLLLLDGSTSMYDGQVWTPTYEALTGPGGPLDLFQDDVRFGFASYRGAGQTIEEDPACAQITSVDYALSNTPSIREAYAELSSVPRWPPWETPTGHALTRVTRDLLLQSPGAAKYILLISDGAPDTCFTTNPQCGQDRSVYALQQAFRAGVETYAIGIGFGNPYPGCTSDTARCGSDHFQDLANAGQGQPVVAPPAGYTTLPCILETDGMLLADYAAQGGSTRYHWTQSPTEVADAVTEALREIVRR